MIVYHTDTVDAKIRRHRYLWPGVWQSHYVVPSVVDADEFPPQELTINRLKRYLFDTLSTDYTFEIDRLTVGTAH